MSNIYIQEPPASGKVLLKTTVGDIDIELWTREAPKACKNFIQLCMEGYYNNTIFHRIVKQFIVQGGDPTGTGQGGDSIYGHPFKDEFHSRLRFCRRGLVAMANAGKDDNGSQFFFTLAATPELQNKHTIFGKVGGDTIYNMLKLEEGLVDEGERPIYPQKILKTEILSNPFSDIVPRKFADSPKEAKESKKKNKIGAVKDFKLLSFGEEAEEDEEETIMLNQKFAGKGKSAHDTLLDPKLSSETAAETCTEESKVEERPTEKELNEMEEQKRKVRDTIKNKLQSHRSKESEKTNGHEKEEEDFGYVLGQSRREERQKKAEEIKKEIRDLKRGVKNEKLKREEEIQKREDKKAKKEKKNELKEDFFETQKQFKELDSKIPKKGKSRENFTQQLMKKFKEKLQNAKLKKSDQKDGEKSDTEDEDSDSWKVHVLHCEKDTPVLAKDASTKNDDWFEIHDPRNPINKRRRGETSGSGKKQRK